MGTTSQGAALTEWVRAITLGIASPKMIKTTMTAPETTVPVTARLQLLISAKWIDI